MTGLSARLDKATVLDEMAATAWPALETENLNGWRLRHTPDSLIRRCNSVLCNRVENNAVLADMIDRAEKFYRARHIAPRFQISPASQPGDLDRELEKRGYITEAPSMVMTTEGLASNPPKTSPDPATTSPVMDEGWLDCYLGEVPDQQQRQGRENILRSIQGEKIFAKINPDNKTRASGLAVINQTFCGIFCMHTLQPDRSQGLGKRILKRLMHEAFQLGARTIYLQVQSDNVRGLEFYRHCGFKTAYGYHYRTLE